MSADVLKSYDWLTDFVTGREVPNIGAEEHRQAVEKFLCEKKGYPPESIGVDVELTLEVRGEPYCSRLDLVIAPGASPFMVIKCAAASLESREKEVIAAARLLSPGPAPYAVVSDGKTAVIYDAIERKKVGEGLSQIPSRDAAEKFMAAYEPAPIAEEHLDREKIIFRSYDSMNQNVQRSLLY